VYDQNVEFLPISVKVLDQKFCIAVFYRPPDSTVSISDTLFYSIELIDISQYSNFILVGDFNVDVSNHLHPLHPKVSTLLELFCLSQVVTGHTRENSAGRCSLLNLVLTTNPNVLHNCFCLLPLTILVYSAFLTCMLPKLSIILGKSGDIHMLISLNLTN